MNTRITFHSIFCPVIFSACLSLIANAQPSWAEDDSAPSTLTPSKAAAMTTAPAEKLLLLHNGKIIKGTIQQSATGYVVVKPEGRMVLPFDQVRLEAENVEDAYHQLRNALPDHSAQAHTELASWCLNNGLKDQAVKELREALRREPGSRTAKNMLQRINDQLLATNALPTVTAKDGKYSLLGDAKPLATVEALGGLPRESAADFVSKVQPLLVNRCATAGCHGPGSGNGFELQRVKLGKGSPKSYSERNLVAVLAHIDRDRPASSPLLTKLRGESTTNVAKQSHGGLSREQMQVVRNWITTLGRNAEAATSPSSVVKKSASASDPEAEMPAEAEPSPPNKVSRPKTANAEAIDPDNDDDDKSFRQLLRKSDPFDPDEFNERE